MNLYDLVKVSFGDSEMMARPIEFEYDEASQPNKILKLVTTCPHCGAGNEIDTSNMEIIEDMVINVQCTECKKGDDISEFLKSANLDEYTGTASQSIAVDTTVVAIPPIPVAPNAERQSLKPQVKSSVTINEKDGSLTCSSAFIDPISLGLFNTEEL